MSAYNHYRATLRPWTPHAGDRVRVRTGSHRGEVGTVVESHPPRVVVQLDAHEVARVFLPRELAGA